MLRIVSLLMYRLILGTDAAALIIAVVSPTYVPDLVQATLDLLIDGAFGVWHLANRDAVTWAAFAQQAANVAGVRADLLEGPPDRLPGSARAGPRFSALASERGWIMPTLADAVERFVHHRKRVLERTAPAAAQP